MENENAIQMHLPDALWDMDEIERYRVGALATTDFAREGQHHYVYGMIEVPMTDGSTPFLWGVWVEVSQANHDAYLNAFQSPEADGLQFEGTLANTLPCYGEDVATPVKVTCFSSRRPAITLLGETPFAQDQRQGYTPEIVSTLQAIFFGEEDPDDAEFDEV